MKTIYTRPICPACHALKAKFKAQDIEFHTLTVFDPAKEPLPPGDSITRNAFKARYPDVKSFPFVVESDHG